MPNPEHIPIVEEGAPLREAPFKIRLASFLAVRALSLFASTWRVEVVGKERLDQLLDEGCHATFWHGRSLVPAWAYRNRRIVVMVSLHQDGEIMNRSLARLGYIRVRGSTTRGGREALGAATRLIKRSTLSTALTPDGPKGPHHSIAPGALLLASRTDKPIIPIGIAARSKWTLNSWDRYMIPKPFTKVRIVVGEPITIPSPLRRPALEAYSEQLSKTLTDLENEAGRF